MENSTVINYLDNTTRPSVYSDQSALAKLPYNISIGVATFLLNAVQIYVFVLMKKKSFSNVLFLSLAISDLLFAAVEMPLFNTNQIFAVWPLGTVMCYFNIIYFGLNFCCSNYYLMILSINRLLQIIQPYRDHEKVTKKKIALLFSPVICLLSLNIIILVVQITTGVFNSSNCSLSPSLFGFVIFILCYSVSVTISLTVNIFNIALIFKQKSRFSRSAGKKSSKSGFQLSVDHTNPSDKPTSLSTNGNVKMKPLNRRRRLAKEKKAVLCIAMLMVNAVVTEYPFILSCLIVTSCLCLFELLEIGLSIVFAFPLMNPLLLFIFHDAFRQNLLAKIRNISSRV